MVLAVRLALLLLDVPYGFLSWYFLQLQQRKYWSLASLSWWYDFIWVYHSLNNWWAMPITLAIHYLSQCVIVPYICEIKINGTVTHATTFRICFHAVSPPPVLASGGLAPSLAGRIQKRFSCSSPELLHCSAPFVASTVWTHSLLAAPGQRARCGAMGTQAGKQQAHRHRRPSLNGHHSRQVGNW